MVSVDVRRDETSSESKPSEVKLILITAAAVILVVMGLNPEQLEYNSRYQKIMKHFDCLLTVAAVLQIGPDDVFLREAENPEPSSSHGGVNSHARICHQLRSLVEPRPDPNTRRGFV